MGSWTVHKIGGGSLTDAEGIRQIPKILAEASGPTALVVSAMSGVTDALLALLESARKGGDRLPEEFEALRKSHLGIADELLPQAAASAVSDALLKSFDDVWGALRTVRLGRTYAQGIADLVAGHGEVWSARIIEAYLRSLGRSTAFVDAREVVIIAHGDTGPVVDWAASGRRLAEHLDTHPAEWLVITGYVASTVAGVPTTLGRNGSDFSAAIFANLLDATSVTIWKNVDGVLSADPKRVPDATILDQISYQEAIALGHFGAKVLHPMTLGPAMSKKIPIYIRNAFDPRRPGTRIDAGRTSDEPVEVGATIKGFSAVDGVALISVEGAGVMSVSGIAERLFRKLKEGGVRLLLVSHSESENCITFAVGAAQAASACSLVEQDFRHELRDSLIKPLVKVDRCSIIAAVGDGLTQAPGAVAKFVAALGKAGVRVRAIAQGSSGRNVSVVIDESASTRALRAVHAGFFLSEHVLSVGVLGLGRVGRALLKQLEAQSALIRRQLGVDLRVRGVMGRERMLLGNERINLGTWGDELGARGTASSLAAFTEHVNGDHPYSVMIDCTASESVPDEYARWLERRIHVITPNSRAGAGPRDRFEAICRAGRQTYTHFFSEATVGPGLPVINSLRDLIQTGDRIVRIETVLAGAVPFVFNSWTQGASFSDLILRAQRLGYTQPNVTEDLSGLDAARKLVILAREVGVRLELRDVVAEGFLPPGQHGEIGSEQSLKHFQSVDETIAARAREAEGKGEVLRYAGLLTADGAARAELRSYPRSHPFSSIGGHASTVIIHTDRSRGQPLILQGPGASADVIAGSVFADLLRLASYLGPRTDARPRPHVSSRDLRPVELESFPRS